MRLIEQPVRRQKTSFATLIKNAALAESAKAGMCACCAAVHGVDPGRARLRHWWDLLLRPCFGDPVTCHSAMPTFFFDRLVIIDPLESGRAVELVSSAPRGQGRLC